MFTSGVALDARVWPPSLKEIEAKVLDMNGLVERDGLVYKKDTTELFTGHVEGIPPHDWTGEVEGTYEKAHAYIKGSYQDGLKHGFWDWYYYDSESQRRENLSHRRTYLYGKKNGLYESYNHSERPRGQSAYEGFYAAGAVMYRKFYKDDLLHGPWEYFNEFGDLILSGMYEDNKPIGVMEQFCYWNYEDHYLCKKEFYNNEGEIEETKCYNVFGEIISFYDGEVSWDFCDPSDSPSVEKADGTLSSRPCTGLEEDFFLCDPSDTSSDSPSVEKADVTLLSRGVPCATLDEVLSYYNSWDDSPPTIINTKSGASFHMLLILRGADAKVFKILYRPVSVGLTDYCNFIQAGFQFPDWSYPVKKLSVGDTYPAEFYFENFYTVWGEQYDESTGEEKHEMYYDDSTGELGHFMGVNSQAYDYTNLKWKFDPLKAKFNLIEYKERRTGEMVSGTHGQPPNFVIDFSVTPPLWKHLLVTETQKLKYSMESAKRHRTADAKRRMDICSDPIKRADYEDYCTRASD